MAVVMWEPAVVLAALADLENLADLEYQGAQMAVELPTESLLSLLNDLLYKLIAAIW